MGSIYFPKSGLFTTIQDQGRFGLRKYGVPVSGAMDLQSAGLANLLVNNPSDVAMLEITLHGPDIVFSHAAVVAITGADISPERDGMPLAMHSAHQIEAGQTISFGKRIYGARAYLAIRGGFHVKKILNSFAYYFPVTENSRIKKGDWISFTEFPGARPPNMAVKLENDHFFSNELEAWAGPEFGLLTRPQVDHLMNGVFKITENNRMGYRLAINKGLENTHNIITSPVSPGTVQLTPAGQLIILMRDGQVTGGYPRVLQLTEKSINRLAQKIAGQKIRFNVVH